MSLIITLYTNEGIVMASDSRITFHTDKQDGQEPYHFDNAYKTFLCPNNAGLSNCGDATVNNMPIAGYIENFINTQLHKDTKVSDIPSLLLKEFSSYTPVLHTTFQIAGYEKENGIILQKIYRVHIAEKTIDEIIAPSFQGIIYNGQIDVLSHLIDDQWYESLNEDNKKIYIQKRPHEVSWDSLSLQDAIDFAVFAIETTKRMEHFERKHESVGGPIDILAIKPTGSFWIKRKELHA